MKIDRLIIVTALVLSFWSITASEKPEKYLNTSSSIIYSIMYSPDVKELIVADNNIVKVFSVSDYETFREFEEVHTRRILTMSVTKNGSLMTTGGRDSLALIWDYSTGKVIKKIKTDGVIISLSISSSGDFLVCGLSNGQVNFYNLPDGDLRHTFTDHDAMVTSVKISSDEKYIVTAAGDRMIFLYDAKTYNLLHTFSEHLSWVRDVAFSNNGFKLISTGDDYALFIHDISDMNDIILQYDKIHGLGWISTVDFFQDNRTIAFANLKGYIRVLGKYALYRHMCKSPVLDIVFKPADSNELFVAVATRGEGVFIMDTEDMDASAY